MWAPFAFGGSGAAITPGDQSASLDWANSLVVMVGASNVEGNVENSGTPCTTLLTYNPFASVSGEVLSNQGHGSTSFSAENGDSFHLMSSTFTNAVQALRGTGNGGTEVLLIFGDPAVNEFLEGAGSRTAAQVLTSWIALVDFYRENGWDPTNDRRLIIVNCLTVDESDWHTPPPYNVAQFNALLASSWSSRADMLIDVSSITADMPDLIHMTPATADDMAELVAAGLMNLE